MDGLRRLLLIVAMGWLCGPVAAQTSQPTTATTDVAAFARLYGVVRYYYPGDAVQGLNWNRFAVYGVSQVRGAHDSQALAASLRGLFDPVTTGVVILPERQPFPAAKPLAADQRQVYWQRLGYAEGVNRYAAYQAKRTARAGVFATTNHAPNIDIEQQRTASAQLLPAEATLFAAPPPGERYAEFPLGAGLKARVPIELSDEEAKATPKQQEAMATLVAKPASFADNPISADQRLADIVVSWNVYRHFYPYWQEVGGDWDSQLEPLLATIDAPATREVQRDNLRHLVALVQDGHGFVYDPRRPTGALPLLLEPIGDALVVAASADPAIRTGDRIVSINGVEFGIWAAKQASLVSGSPQWRRWQLASALNAGPAGTPVTLGLEREDRMLDATLTYQKQAPKPVPSRPEPVAQLKDGVWYLDITRASQQDLSDHLGPFSQARALIVDLRGYPTPMTGMQLLRHLLAEPEHAQWMHVPNDEAPFDQPVSYTGLGWNLTPAAPHIPGKMVVLTNGRAISQAESILGYVADLHLATIVGSPSAGTNGDVQNFYTPSGYRISFTGLRVTRHDGVTPFHLHGVTPDIAVNPSLEDIRAGRDVVLEQALKLCQ
ncbi:S41 family peptidase [Dyella sp. RRB7]|uniref:S41 family peptidase n=1 Tax=Dyella sp. RRB7 TaxID=2919502 RepID=UPI001FAA6D32|nr:S41 family peptidase [Dyella sp. RRB7]